MVPFCKSGIPKLHLGEAYVVSPGFIKTRHPKKNMLSDKCGSGSVLTSEAFNEDQMLIRLVVSSDATDLVFTNFRIRIRM